MVNNKKNVRDINANVLMVRTNNSGNLAIFRITAIAFRICSSDSENRQVMMEIMELKMLLAG